MLAARESMTFGKRRYHHAVDSQILQAECRTDNIHNRVNCTDFMEMNLADRDSVCFRIMYILQRNAKPFRPSPPSDSLPIGIAELSGDNRVQ